MKKIFLFLISILFFVNFLFSAGIKKEPEKEKVEIKNAQDIVDYLERSGFTGSEIKEGIYAKIFKLISMRDYRGLYNSNRYSILIMDFEKSYGFNIAVYIFQILTLLNQRDVYKDRPYIISIAGSKQDRQKIIEKLKIVLPSLMEIEDKEY